MNEMNFRKSPPPLFARLVIKRGLSELIVKLLQNIYLNDNILKL